MHEKSIQTLEFSKILERVGREAAFSASKELVLALTPSPDLQEARRRLAYTSEAARLIDMKADAGVRSAHDIRPQLTRAAREGVLQPADLVQVQETLRSGIYVGNLLEKLDAEQFPLLQRLGADIPQRPQIVRRIEQTISEEGEVLDTASPTLQRLRFEMRGTNQRLQERLRSMVNEFGNALQEHIVTIRNDRYVLPVKAEHRGRVRGIVHDQSSSGATVFIEPMAVVELNNKLRQLQIEEQQEIERILRVLSLEIGGEADSLTVAVELLAEFDLHLAKARYGRMTRSTEPHLNEEGRIDLHQARHPLLTGKVVPIDFHLGRDFSMVVITGPNTGGKTVALKTVGLLTLMAQAGLHVPADSFSEIAVFEDVFADIGDEQSIEQSLSTFSSHQSNIVDILRRIESLEKAEILDIRGRLAETLIQRGEHPARVLVLLDELGAGTDPSEGSALARAILTYLLEHHITTVATTHYSELKAFAHEQAGVVNASVEFDVETLSPTYRLNIGLPGRSNALAIATRLGMNREIIEKARDFLGTAGVRMENLLEDLQSERKAVSDERFNLNMERVEAEYQRKQLEQERHQLEEERVRILNQARAQAARELDDVRSSLAKVKVDVSRVNLTRERLDQDRNRVRNLEKKVTQLPEPHQPKKVETPAERQEGPLQIGDTVRVLSFGQNAEVLGLSAGRGEADVQMGALRLRVSVDNLERVSKRQAQAAATERAQSQSGVSLPRYEDLPDVATQLDIRGWRVDDALAELDSYLDDAAMSGINAVRIVHGKGTGALRTAVRDLLAHSPLVKSYESAAPADGGDGVTVARLNA